MRNASDNPRTTAANKVVTAAEAVRRIDHGATVATGGFIGIGFAEGLAIALEQRFLGQAPASPAGSPSGLTLVYAGGQGDGHDRGLNHLAHAGLLHCVIGGHWGLAPKLQQLALDNQIEAYNLPQGVISQLFRDIAAHRPGLITKVGLGTFVDPRRGGGRVNACSQRALVSLMHIDDEAYLLYKSFPINACLLRGTTADEHGNISMEHEALTLDSLAIAMATHNSGGIVIVQVERLAKAGSLSSRQVQIPGILVDHVVLAEKPEHHMQTFTESYNAVFSGELQAPPIAWQHTPLNARKIMARRAALELRAHDIVNLGVGIPECIAAVASEENLVDLMTLTAEPGVVGGLPASGLNFGAATNAEAILDQPYQFDFYDGGGLDIAFLGLAQVDVQGNVDVSQFNDHLAGAGGFINISQSTRRLVFMGAFCAGHQDTQVTDGKLSITCEADTKKFVNAVEQITFNGMDAITREQHVLYVTERCVFRLKEGGLELIEIAPGIDLDVDILARMGFSPAISPHLTCMDARIFCEAPMSLRADILCAAQPLKVLL
ncbi:CoA-transferase [Limnohabitans sp.]|uniref:acyl CoA:acetate/3-ketoacid CoA transferase n=1 Tax=Limnohabitans sp. TaxID=1907725 RepID=UPI00286F9FB5|nr:malonate decarboxylase subunit alpha [Limnohabitans sp.]